MNLLERQAANRNWSEDERLVLDQLQRVADDIIAPKAAEYDAASSFPQASMGAINRADNPSAFR